jgi:hypothetical protein
MFDLIWEEKLGFLVQQDHQMRDVLLQKGVLSDAYHPEMEKVHLSNAHKLAAMIDKMGFPVLSNAGEQGVRYSWLIIQNSISWPLFMKESLLQMRLAAAQRDYILELLAYTEDRVAYFEGRPQIYGTNKDWINGELKMTPVEDIKSLDARRKGMGLPPISQAINSTLERPPRDPEKKARELEDWLLKVRWRN